MNHTNRTTCLLQLLLLLLGSPILSGAQDFNRQKTPNRDDYVIPIKKTGDQILIDGFLDEPPWLQSAVAKDFWRVLPIDTGYADTKTEVRVAYDERNLYFGITCFERAPGRNIIESLRRDFSFGANDNFLIFIDTYNDQTNGFSFGASAGGAQWDGIQADGGFVSLDWDCKWESAVKHFDGYWNIEMSIPLRNLQFKAGMNEWGINFSRMDVKNNEKSSWAPVPRQFQTASLAYAGTLQWDAPPPKPKTNISLIPYALGEVVKDYESDAPASVGADAGLDAKIALTPSLQLDLTVNQDFSQVDVDEQVTNLDRFELFFPERRRFFLENKDLFTGFGNDDVRPFFSRRIGLNNPVRAGMRLSGKLDEKLRVGFLNMQTGTAISDTDTIPAANFTVASLQRRVFTRSNIGVFFINKQLTADEIDRPVNANRYNRVIGLDYNLASADNKWTGKFFYHRSFSPSREGDKLQEPYAYSSFLVYETEQLRLQFSYDRLGSGYRAETGFVRRTGLHRLTPGVGYKFYPASAKIANHGPSLFAEFIFIPGLDLTDRNIWASYDIQFLNRSSLELSYRREYVKLIDPFDPTNSEGNFLNAGTDYDWQVVELEYQSDARKLFNYNFEIGYGGFFNGDRFNLDGEIAFRFQPYGSISVNLSYNNLQFPAPFQDVDFFLIGPKLDVTFTNKIFLTAFLQYNEQIDNINTNIRFQWRYQPVSDLFIVYSDNYFPAPLNVKNRALVAKISYWFN